MCRTDAAYYGLGAQLNTSSVYGMYYHIVEVTPEAPSLDAAVYRQVRDGDIVSVNADEGYVEILD